MFEIKTLVLVIALFVIFIISVKQALKKANELKSGWRKLILKLNWWKLILEFYAISFVFYISIRIFGLFGADLTRFMEFKENVWLCEILFFLILPAIFVIFSLLMPLIIMMALPYNREEKKYRNLLHSFLFNKFYLIMVLANILTGLRT